MKYEIRTYTEAGKCPYDQWHSKLDAKAAAKVDRYVLRMAYGNTGSAKRLRDGISELRINHGPGYRVYFGIDGQTLVILLAGGSKRTQKRDIEQAVNRWQRYTETR